MTTTRLDPKDLLARLKLNEGVKLFPYICPAGKLTVGWGRNLEERGITKEEAEVMLMTDMRVALEALDHTYPWWRSMTSPRQIALADMAFNLGITGLTKFRKMITALSQQRWTDAAEECLWNDKTHGVATKYAEQVGRRAVRNAHAFEFGEFPK